MRARKWEEEDKDEEKEEQHDAAEPKEAVPKPLKKRAGSVSRK